MKRQRNCRSKTKRVSKLITASNHSLPGETAVLTTKAPSAGLAWVSVETDEILDTLLVPLSGNAGRIELPIKKEYAPNAFVSVYLTRPGGEDKLPRERFAFTEIAVRRPDRELKIESRLTKRDRASRRDNSRRCARHLRWKTCAECGPRRIRG